MNTNIEGSQKGNYQKSSKEVYELVKEYYGKVLQSSKDLKTSACTTTSCKSVPSYIHDIIDNSVPKEISDKYYGCGSTVPLGIEGLNILDLGSGSGRDCYVAAKLVGENGNVTGVDMTDEQVSVANKYVAEYMKTLGYKRTNLNFKKGYIEFLEDAGIPKDSINICISNCVVNLSPNKEQVLNSVYNILKTGGEFYFSDVYCDRRLPESVRKNNLLFGECIAGALYINDFVHLAKEIGFKDPRVVDKSEIKIYDEDLKNILGNAKFYSITYRLFKLKDLESKCEDYGQCAIYNGKLTGAKHGYVLDDHHYFETGKRVLVCGNTASMLQDTWLKPYFTVEGNRDIHFGEFDCSSGSSTLTGNSTSSSSSSSCSSGSCGGGSCC